jgi:hypothetical protein
MHRRLAHWYGTHKGRGHAAFALSHAIVGRDWERAHYIWTHHSTEMLLEHPRPPLESLRAVPADVVTVHPWIRLAQAISNVAIVDDNADGQMAVLRAYAEASRRAAAPASLSWLCLMHSMSVLAPCSLIVWRATLPWPTRLAGAFNSKQRRS